MDRRILLAAGAVAAAVALFLALRPNGETPTPANQRTTNEGTTTNPGTAPAQPPSAQVRIAFEDGRVPGGVKHPSVSRGERVVVLVRADVRDEVHVHGYDLMRDVAPGRPARIAFRASTVGVFEIELEQRHLLLAELAVEP